LRVRRLPALSGEEVPVGAGDADEGDSRESLDSGWQRDVAEAGAVGLPGRG